MSDVLALVASLRLPVLAAPMFLVSGPELVVAASKAGVLGSFPTPNCRTTDELDTWMGTIVDGLRTDDGGTLPWAVNVVTHRSNARLADDLRVIAEHRPPVVISALGSPRPALEVVHGYGGVVVADVVNLALAGKAAAAGADVLSCVSAGSGGHTGHLSPFAFVSAVRELFDGPVVVGGGIADGAGVAGAVAAGADLVSIGTLFLAAAESLAEPDYKQMVVDHGADDLVISAGVTGTAASWLRPSLVAHGLDPDALGPVTRDYRSDETTGSRWKDIWAAGQGLGLVRGVEPVAAIVDRLEREYDEAVVRFAAITMSR